MAFTAISSSLRGVGGSWLLKFFQYFSHMALLAMHTQHLPSPLRMWRGPRVFVKIYVFHFASVLIVVNAPKELFYNGKDVLRVLFVMEIFL